MAEHKLKFPATEEDVAQAARRDLVTVDGHIIGIRDPLTDPHLDQGVEPPLA